MTFLETGPLVQGGGIAVAPVTPNLKFLKVLQASPALQVTAYSGGQPAVAAA